MEFVDIAGLVAGASKGRTGQSVSLPTFARRTLLLTWFAVLQMKTSFVANKIDPAADIEVINTELALADLDTADKALKRLGRALPKGATKKPSCR